MEAAQSIEEYRAAKLAKIAKERETALRKFQKLAYRRPGAYSHPWGQHLVFDDGGKARLACIAGWLTGLAHAGSMKGLPLDELAACGTPSLVELAGKLALDLDGQLTLLGTWGGELEISVDGGQQTVKVPNGKVVLGDDGTFNGFTLMYYGPYTTEQIQAKAREHDEASYQGREADGTTLSEEDSRKRWDAALEWAKKELRIREKVDEMDFTETRHYTPQWVQERKAEYEEAHKGHEKPETSIYSCEECDIGRYTLSGSTEWVRYGFNFNGAMLYRGPGGAQLFSITIDPGAGTERYWSRHH